MSERRIGLWHVLRRTMAVVFIGSIASCLLFGVAYAVVGGVIGGGIVLVLLSLAQYPFMRYASRRIEEDEKLRTPKNR